MILNQYILYCAVKIQKCYRGHLARKFAIPVRHAFSPYKISRINAVIRGWKIRNIMRLRETKNRINFVKEHEMLSLEETEFAKKEAFLNGRFAAIHSLINYINQLDRKGNWVMAVRNEEAKFNTNRKR